MSRNRENIWEFKTARFTVQFCVEPEDDLDLSWDDDGSTREGLENGQYVAFVACMRVLLDGNEIAADYLGNCVYNSAQEFIDHRGNKTGSYFSDMVRSAIAEARKNVARLQSIKLRAVQS